MNIVLTGSLAIDRIMSFPGHFKEHILPDSIHAINVSFNIDRLEEKRGGTAGNIAYTLKLLDKKPKIVAAAGNDFNLYMDYMKGLGQDVSGIEEQEDLTTASAYIMTDRDDNQITAFFMGAMARETHFDMTTLNKKDSIVMLSPGNKSDMLRYSAECKIAGVKYVFDPGQTLPFIEPDEIKTLLDGSYMMMVNDYELQMIMKRTGLSRGDVESMTEMLVVTLGKEGSTITTNNITVEVPVCKVEDMKDPTGAGDAYRAGFLTGLDNNLDLDVVGRVAATTAAYACEHYGTQEHNFSLDEFCARFKKNFSQSCPII
ncbi:MAG: carbohydrate kinase family protein [Candidatus Kerfeldbacteria bacterium]